MPQEPIINDVAGIKPYGEALKVTVEKSLETAQTFLYALCRPAAEEVGLLLRDRVRDWRATNLSRIANKAHGLISITEDGAQLRAPPRIVHELMEHGSWCEDEQLQQMWAGLLATSCSPDGKDESNLLFMDILKRLSSVEAKFIEHVCKKVKLRLDRKGYLAAPPLDISIEEILSVTGWSDKTLARAHLNHLTSLGLLADQPDINFGKQPLFPWVQAQSLALHFYVRCTGSLKTPEQFFGVKQVQ